MKKMLLALALIVLALAAYLSLWPVLIEPVAWAAPESPGYTGPHARTPARQHASNQRLARLQHIDLKARAGPSTSPSGGTASCTPRWKAARSCA